VSEGIWTAEVWLFVNFTLSFTVTKPYLSRMYALLTEIFAPDAVAPA